MLQRNCWIWIATTNIKVRVGAHTKVGPFLLESGNGIG